MPLCVSALVGEICAAVSSGASGSHECQVLGDQRELRLDIGCAGRATHVYVRVALGRTPWIQPRKGVVQPSFNATYAAYGDAPVVRAPLEQATINALYTVELCAADVPVHAGADRPLRRPPADARWFHGADGLGDMGYPPPRRKPHVDHAVDAIISNVHAHPGLEIVTLGPLTNIAHAIQRDSRIAQSVSRCVVMGGNPCCEGKLQSIPPE